MRLHPAVTVDEALAFLRQQAEMSWGAERLPDLEENLATMAEAMAAISAIEIPSDVEPLFP